MIDRDVLVVAAAARREAMTGRSSSGGRDARAVAPVDVGVARRVPGRAALRTETTTRGGKEFVRLDGIASVTDRPYRMWDAFGEYDEVIENRAFVDTLAAGPDVVYLLNHSGPTLARTTNDTLRLSLTDEGLRSEALLNPQRDPVRDLLLAIDDGVITEMSFAFRITTGAWSDDFTQYRISALDLHRGDVSAVNFGANPYTTSSRTARDVLDELDRLPAGAVPAALSRLAARHTGPLPTIPAPSPAPGCSVDDYTRLIAAAALPEGAPA